MGRAPEVSGGGLAYDPLDQEMVLFGGCGTVCPGNATWAYNGLSWTELSGTETPPALDGFAFAWDPQWGGVLLTGGIYPNGSASNATWLWTPPDVWHDLTATVNDPALGGRASPDEAYGSMAYDGALHEMVVVNGCTSTSSACDADLRGETYALGGTGSVWTNVSGTFKTSGAPYPGNGSGRFGASMVYDPADQELVYFGGENAAGAVTNDTWIMNVTGWYNVTSTASGCVPSPETCTSHYYPGNGSAFGGMTWDGQLDEAVLVGGLDQAGIATNTTSVFTGGAWYPLCGGACPAPLPTPGQASEVASNSSDVAVLLLQGTCASGSSCIGDDWVLEVPPEPVLSSISPSPAEVGVPVEIVATDTLGAGSGPIVDGRINDSALDTSLGTVSNANFSSVVRFTTNFTFTKAGAYSVYASIEDFFTVVGTTAATPVGVNATLTAAPTANPSPDEVGTPVTFSAAAAFGVPPYRYLWQFGDKNTSTGSGPTHSYSTANTYHGWVNVTDHDGASANASFTVTVFPTLTATGETSGVETDVGFGLLFVGEVSGGTDNYSSYLWTFGDGNSSTSETAEHSYSKPGSVTVAFQATDSAGFTATDTGKLRINPDLSASPITASTLTPSTGMTVAFNLTPRNGTPGYAYVWSFDDGRTSTAASPKYAFGTAGVYEVSVTVSDSVRAFVTKTIVVTVSAPKATGILADLRNAVGLDGLVIGLVAGSLLLVVLIYLRPRRPSGRSPPSEPPTEPSPEAPPEPTTAPETPPPLDPLEAEGPLLDPTDLPP